MWNNYQKTIRKPSENHQKTKVFRTFPLIVSSTLFSYFVILLRKILIIYKSNYKYDVRSGVGVSDTDIAKAKIELKEIFDKAQKNSYRILKYYDSEITYQGTYELDFINFCIDNNINFSQYA